MSQTLQGTLAHCQHSPLLATATRAPPVRHHWATPTPYTQPVIIWGLKDKSLALLNFLKGFVIFLFDTKALAVFLL